MRVFCIFTNLFKFYFTNAAASSLREGRWQRQAYPHRKAKQEGIEGAKGAHSAAE